MDKTFIRDLKVHAIIGVYDFERKHAQPLSFDIEMECSLARAAATDDLEHAVNYAAVSDDVIHIAKTLQPQLVETLVERIAQHILETYHVGSVTVRVSKPNAVPAAAAVGVEITRRQPEY
jgi:dihydroneopterin aldolase